MFCVEICHLFTIFKRWGERQEKDCSPLWEVPILCRNYLLMTVESTDKGSTSNSIPKLESKQERHPIQLILWKWHLKTTKRHGCWKGYSRKSWACKTSSVFKVAWRFCKLLCFVPAQICACTEMMSPILFVRFLSLICCVASCTGSKKELEFWIKLLDQLHLCLPWVCMAQL